MRPIECIGLDERIVCLNDVAYGKQRHVALAPLLVIAELVNIRFAHHEPADAICVFLPWREILAVVGSWEEPPFKKKLSAFTSKSNSSQKNSRIENDILRSELGLNRQHLHRRIILPMPLHAHVTLALVELEDADFLVAAMLNNFCFDACTLNKRSANHHFTIVLLYQKHIAERDFLIFFSILERNVKGIPFLDHFLETGDGDNCKHEKRRESWWSVKNEGNQCKTDLAVKIFELRYLHELYPPL